MIVVPRVRAINGPNVSELVHDPLDALPRAEAQIERNRSRQQLEVPRDRAEVVVVDRHVVAAGSDWFGRARRGGPEPLPRPRRPIGRIGGTPLPS